MKVTKRRLNIQLSETNKQLAFLNKRKQTIISEYNARQVELENAGCIDIAHEDTIKTIKLLEDLGNRIRIQDKQLKHLKKVAKEMVALWNLTN